MATGTLLAGILTLINSLQSDASNTLSNTVTIITAILTVSAAVTTCLQIKDRKKFQTSPEHEEVQTLLKGMEKEKNRRAQRIKKLN